MNTRMIEIINQYNDPDIPAISDLHSAIDGLINDIFGRHDLSNSEAAQVARAVCNTCIEGSIEVLTSE